MLSEINRLKKYKELDSAFKNCNTTKVSKFSKKLTDKFVTAGLIEAFNKELQELRIDVQIGFEQSSQKGKSFHQLALQNSGGIQLSNVLSEGESRAVSLASFLAEIAVREDNSTIVFDDPVSSLDHERRMFVAKRLVKEGRIRPIIIFTHDLVFLKFLESYSKERNISCQINEIRKEKQTSGLCENEPPWVAMSVRAQLGKLKTMVQDIRSKKENSEMEIIFGFAKLRQCSERALEMVLLHGCVERFNRGVRATTLKEVLELTQEDVFQFQDIYDSTTTFSQSHDGSPAENPPIANHRRVREGG